MVKKCVDCGISKSSKGIYCKKCRYNHATRPSGLKYTLHKENPTSFKKGQFAWGDHPSFKNGIWAYRKFRKDNCEHCGTDKNLFVHHIDHDRTNNNPNNFRTVCAKCHATIEHPRKFYGNQYTGRIYA